MRPADLYVPNSATVPAARPFEWDLRPWASGGAAVPTRPSSFGGQRGPTSVDREKLHAEWTSGGLASGFHDEEIVLEVLDGITDDVPSMSGSFLCGPHTGALRHIETATAKVGERKTVERKTLLELLGRLNFAATFYPMGRQWLHAPWRALRAQYRTANGDVIVTATVRAQLKRWILELENPEHEGVPFGAARAFPGAAEPSALADPSV